MIVRAIGAAAAPDEVVMRTPLSLNWPKIGWSMPAENVCSQRRLGAASAVNSTCRVRPGNESAERNAASTRASSDSSTGDSPTSGTSSQPGAAAASRSA